MKPKALHAVPETPGTSLHYLQQKAPNDHWLSGRVFEDAFQWDSAPAPRISSTLAAPEPAFALAAADAFTLTFRDGLNGYAGTRDTEISQASPTRNYAGSTSVSVDQTPQAREGLLQFTNLFGAAAGQIPAGAQIISATLTLTTTNKGDGATLYRMLQPWAEATTWNAWGGNGIQANGVEAAASPELNTGPQGTGAVSFDVTASLLAWAQNPSGNHGWVFMPNGSDGWDWASRESAAKPQLAVQYSLPAPANNPPVANNDSGSTLTGKSVILNVLANDTDPDGDALTVASFTQAANGAVTLNTDGTLTYTPKANFFGSDSFTYIASDGRGGTDPATVSINVSGQTLSKSFQATTDAGGWLRNFQHDNAAKSFYHDGQWFALIPNNGYWYVHREGGGSGFTIASPRLGDTQRIADVAFDDATNTLYVLHTNTTSTKPSLYKLVYDTASDTWAISANVQLGGLGGVLTGTQWQKNPEMVLSIDPVTHLPIVAVVGQSTTPGLYLASPTNSSLSSWTQALVDADTNSSGGSNGNSKADIVSYKDASGAAHIAILYSADGATLDNWRVASHDAGTGYSGGWNLGTVTSNVVIDNHISAVSDGSKIYMAMKDDKNNIWLSVGTPEGGFAAPVLVTGVSNPSRPTLVLDETHHQLYVFYQQNTWDPYGSIYMKSASTDGPITFDPGTLGTEVMTTGNGQDLIDPQVPAMNVGDNTGGYFYLLAKNQDASSFWYNDIFV